jgi:hypothetical protein
VHWIAALVPVVLSDLLLAAVMESKEALLQAANANVSINAA